jgi:hypothetical protein
MLLNIMMRGADGHSCMPSVVLRALIMRTRFLFMDSTLAANIDCILRTGAPLTEWRVAAIYGARDSLLCSRFPTALSLSSSMNYIDSRVAKNIGMEVKDSQGRYVMVDDPRLQPIYRDIADHNKTLIAHQAEPDVAWTPDPKAIDSSYYAEHPEWNMSKLPGAPSKAEILAARDRLLAENPGLKVIGAHLGSMESNVDFVADRLDRYANFAVDTAARVPHLTISAGPGCAPFSSSTRTACSMGRTPTSSGRPM